MVLALRTLFPDCRTSAKLGAIAMPKGVLAALLEAADPGPCDIRVGGTQQNECANWLTDVTRDLLAPFPSGFRRLSPLSAAAPLCRGSNSRQSAVGKPRDPSGGK